MAAGAHIHSMEDHADEQKEVIKAAHTFEEGLQVVREVTEIFESDSDRLLQLVKENSEHIENLKAAATALGAADVDAKVQQARDLSASSLMRDGFGPQRRLLNGVKTAIEALPPEGVDETVLLKTFADAIPLVKWLNEKDEFHGPLVEALKTDDPTETVAKAKELSDLVAVWSETSGNDLPAGVPEDLLEQHILNGVELVVPFFSRDGKEPLVLTPASVNATLGYMPDDAQMEAIFDPTRAIAEIKNFAGSDVGRFRIPVSNREQPIEVYSADAIDAALQPVLDEGGRVLNVRFKKDVDVIEAAKANRDGVEYTDESGANGIKSTDTDTIEPKGTIDLTKPLETLPVRFKIDVSHAAA